MITPAKFLGLLALCTALSASIFTSQAADTPQRDSRSIINSLRLKSLTKSLELTAEQQKQVQALFDEEAKEVAKLPESLSAVQRSDKIKEMQQITYGKMKPILTPAQVEKWDKMQADAAKKKKKPADKKPEAK
jgi:Spy/CpxP family protein refolding chaperone